MIISIEQVESAINHSKAAMPPEDGSLVSDTRVLAGLYGLMIHYRLREVDDSFLALHKLDRERYVALIERWAGASGKSVERIA